MMRPPCSVVLAVVLCAGAALAETQADIAARENDEGKELMYAGNFDDASAKFRDASLRAPEPKYLFNLCTSMFQAGKFGDAVGACRSATKELIASPDDKLKDKVDKLAQRIYDEAKAQGLELPAPGGARIDASGTAAPAETAGGSSAAAPAAEPTTTPAAAYASVVGRPPEQALFKSITPDHSYLWTLGFDVYGGGANFQGEVAGKAAFGRASGGLRGKTDYLLSRSARLGVEGYLAYSTVNSNAGAMQTAMFGQLNILDAGLGIYKHLCLRNVERLCLTPLLGAGLAFMDPSIKQGDAPTYNYLSAAIRAELAANLAFGDRYQHVFSIALDVRYYTSAFDNPTDGSPPRSQVGLADPGEVGTLCIGYTYRFNTPLGSRAFITLE